MKKSKSWSMAIFVIFLVAIHLNIAGAAVVSTSNITFDASPPSVVTGDAFNISGMYYFDEIQGYILASELAVDVGANISAGTSVDSYFVYHDPVGAEWQSGTMTFDADVLGVIHLQDALVASNYLGKPSLTYNLSCVNCWWDGPAVISADKRTVTLSCSASSPGDFLRVITRAEEIHISCANKRLISDTSQSISYTPTLGEDSDYSINKPSYTKLDAFGNELADDAGEWAMVKDNVTGLIWEVKTDDGGIHDRDDTYTWQAAEDSFIKKLNDNEYGGFSDWHIPTIEELHSLSDRGTIDPAINSLYFPNAFADAPPPYAYASSTSYAGSPDEAWCVVFYNGYRDHYSKTYGFRVRAVRGFQVCAAEKLVDNGDGTITDVRSGLMWQKATSSSRMNWEKALVYAEGLLLGGYDDWRLPNINELDSIIDASNVSPSIDTGFFPDTVSEVYASSTSHYQEQYIWGVYFGDGTDYLTPLKTQNRHIRAVRGGQNGIPANLFISSPAQASKWTSGNLMPIRWYDRGISGNVQVLLSRDGGMPGSFETIAESIPNDGTHDWPVKGPSSYNCFLKIVPLEEPSSATVQGLFTIIDPLTFEMSPAEPEWGDTITVTPRGGAGENYTVLHRRPDGTSESKAVSYGGSALFTSMGSSEGEGLLRVTDDITGEYVEQTYDVDEPEPTIDSFTRSPKELPAGGGTVRLSWTVTGAASASIDQGVGSIAGALPSGSRSVGVSTDTTFTLTAANSSGEIVTADVSITVAETDVVAPMINSFYSSETEIDFGDSFTMVWNITGADTAVVDQGIGDLLSTESGTMEVTPSISGDLTFTLTAVNSEGTVTASFTITVNPSGEVTYTVIFTATENGSISGETSQTVKSGGDCTPVTAVPDEGYHFTGWSGDYTGSENPVTITNVSSDMNISANFVPDTHTITATAGSGGSISPSGAVSVEHGASQVFSVTPDDGYKIDDIEVDGSSLGTMDTYEFTNVTENHSIFATFRRNIPTINLGDGNGSPGQDVTLPIILENLNGTEISAISVDIGFDNSAVEKPQASIGPAGEAAEKEIEENLVSPGIYRISIFSLSNNIPIGSGVVAYVTFKINSDAPTGATPLTNTPSASDSLGGEVTVEGSDGAIAVSSGLAGDCDGDEVVSIAEVQSAVNMHLEIVPIESCVDVNENGMVSIGEIQQAVNNHLGISGPSSDKIMFDDKPGISLATEIVGRTSLLDLTLPLLELERISAEPGERVSVAINVANATGYELSAISADITYDNSKLENPAVEIGPAGSDAGKEIVFSEISPGVIRVSVLSLSNNNPIDNGIVALLKFDVKEDATSGSIVLETSPSGTDPFGNILEVLGENGSIEIIGSDVISVANVDHQWKTITYREGLESPVVLLGPPTYHGPQPGVVRIRNLGAGSFDLRFQEWLYLDGTHKKEKVPYMVLDEGRYPGEGGGLWEVGSFSLNGTGNWQALTFKEALPAAPALFMTIQTFNGTDPVTVRARNVTKEGFEAALFEEEARMDGHVTEKIGYLAIYNPELSGVVTIGDAEDIPYLLQAESVDHRFVPVASYLLKAEEEQSLDDELAHLDEAVSVLVLGNRLFAQDISCKGNNTVALRQQIPEYESPMEWGTVRGVNHMWLQVPLFKKFTDPIVVSKNVSFEGADPGVLRVRNTGGDSFQLKYDEWLYLDGLHTLEKVFYLVCESGEHDLGGLSIKAGKLRSNKTLLDGWELVNFPSEFPEIPAVFTAVQSFNDHEPVTTRNTGCSWSDFSITMQEEEWKEDGHLEETLGWIAIEKGDAITEDGRQVVVLDGAADHNPYTLDFGISLARRFPVIMSDMNTINGENTCTLRYRKLTPSSVELFLQEELSWDDETGHVMEDVVVFAAE